MIYNCKNCAAGCLIVDSDGVEGIELQQVVSVDTHTRQLEQYEIPLRVVGDELARITRTFERADIILDSFNRAGVITLHGLQP